MNEAFVASYGKNPDWKSVITAMDTNNDGLIDYGEFLTAATNRVDLLTKQNLAAAFNAIDVKGDGKITADEL